MRPNFSLSRVLAPRPPSHAFESHAFARSKKRPGAAIATVLAAAALSSIGALGSVSAAAAKDTMAECTKFVDAWRAAYNAKNADALASMYEPKTGTYSSVFWTGSGRAVLAQAFKQELASGNTMTSITCDRSNATGDVIASSGTWSASSMGPKGKPMAIKGHWQSLAAGRNGKYAILDHTSNMQLPPPK